MSGAQWSYLIYKFVWIIEIALQVNGKFRENLVIGAEDSKEEVLTKAKETLASRIEGKTIVKEIYVPGKIVNIVVK